MAKNCTGSSRGLGKAVTVAAVEGNTYVVGLVWGQAFYTLIRFPSISGKVECITCYTVDGKIPCIFERKIPLI